MGCDGNRFKLDGIQWDIVMNESEGSGLLIEIEHDQLRKLQIDGRGRVTIPKEFRDHYGLQKGDSVKVALLDVITDGYTCDECEQVYNLPEVLVLNHDSEDERVVCAECSTASDRIV